MAKNISVFFVFLMFSFFAANAPAIELALEENRGESGTIGYVDIERVFREYSGTTEARENFLKDVKKKEDGLNLKKSEIFSLKAEIARLKQEKEFALKLPILLKQQEELLEAAKALEDAERQMQTAKANEKEAKALGNGVTISSATADIVISSAALYADATVIPPQETETSTHAAAPDGAVKQVLNMPGIENVPLDLFKFSISTSAADIELSIFKKEEDVRIKQEQLAVLQRQAELELLSTESRKTEKILGRIYITLKELAVKESISVIVDKRSILFGHSAVDLTDKLLKKLEEEQ
ncbi:MAG: OmpH family outer membrane protein [Elusimicrobia bacterium]|nr:OmpH family outer membrane protein [Elusimicrobiota bacterium]